MDKLFTEVEYIFFPSRRANRERGYKFSVLFRYIRTTRFPTVQ